MRDVAIEVVSWSPDGNDALLVSAAENPAQQTKRYSDLTKGVFHGPIYTILDSPSGSFVRLSSTPANKILLLFWSADGKSLLLLCGMQDAHSHERRETFFRVAISHRGRIELGAITKASVREVDGSISPYLRKLLAVWKEGKGWIQYRSPLADFYQTASQSIAVAPLSKKVFMSSEISPPKIESAAVAVADKNRAIWTATEYLGEANPISFWSSDENRVFFLGRTAPRPERLSTWVWLDPFTGGRPSFI